MYSTLFFKPTTKKFFTDSCCDNLHLPANFHSVPSETFSPVSNVSEQENHYSLEIELPGLDKKDIGIEVTDRTLTIKSLPTEKQEEEGKDKNSKSKNDLPTSYKNKYESQYKKFETSWKLSKGIDADKITANHKNGVLSLHLPKRVEEKAEPQKIEIQ